MPEPTEWEFTADVAKWVQQVIDDDPSLPFSEAKCETRTVGSLRRSDLVILDKNARPVLTGEVKLPWQPQGGTPFNDRLVSDARAKAKRAKAPFFFTWNVSQFVLWEPFAPRAAYTQRPYRIWQVTRVHKPEHLYLSPTIQAIRSWLTRFLAELAAIVRGEVPLGAKRPDEQFTDRLEAALARPIALTLEELLGRYKKPREKSEIDAWMRDDLGFTITSDPEGIRDNLDRAAHFACYALVNRLVFYEALLKRYRRQLDRIEVPDHITTGDELRRHLAAHFARAVKATRDYETVFGEQLASLGERVPFYSDHAVPHWREIIAQIHQFDFSNLDYEVIGSIFERFVSPEERSKFGQFYTRVEVVDLINSFCIRSGDAKVMDPACGGGTFLVRAYARKRELDPGRSHADLLADLFGVDISPFATHLTTINLATRDLIEEENYPQVARHDFFDVARTKPLRQLPMPRAARAAAKSLGKGQFRNVWVPPLDAVVANPPYIRQEEISKLPKKKVGKEDKPAKEYLLDLVKSESGAELSGRSDIHCYFWPHAASFLKPDGYLGFITSSQWLDVEYGFRLQEWILRNFEIIAIFESVDEPWFVGARVATAVTILRRQPDEAKRMENVVRFVQLRKPIREILAHDGTTIGAIQAADAFRDEILALTANTVNDRYRARLVPQAKLWNDGVSLGVLMGVGTRGSRVPHHPTGEPPLATSRPPEGGTTNPQAPVCSPAFRRSCPLPTTKDQEPPEGGTTNHSMSGKYYGGKWGVYLRAPDLWFELLDRYGDRLVPLAQIAEVRFGVKSGKDCFFFPRDASAECLEAEPDPAEFHARYGVPRADVASGRVKLVRCGEGRGEIKPIEAEYLEPEVHNLMEIRRFTVCPSDCSRMILLVGKPKSQLQGTYVLDYINWGESQGYHTGVSCANRVTANRPWYDLTGHERGAIFWPMIQKYRHVIALNAYSLVCNHNLFDISPKPGIENKVLAAIVNSSFVVLSKFQYGRFAGTEGTLKTEVVDINMMVVPSPLGAERKTIERVARAFDRIGVREALAFISERRFNEPSYREAGRESELSALPDICELDMEDRRDLDDAVLEMLGEKLPERRSALLDALYACLRELFQRNREIEWKTNVNKRIAKRRGAARPAEVAAEILKEIKAKEPWMLQSYDPGFLDTAKPYDTYELPAQGEPSQEALFPTRVKFGRGKKVVGVVETKSAAQAELIVTLANNGVRGPVGVPRDDEECRRVHERYVDFVARRMERVRALVQERTADEEMQARICDILLPQLERGA